MKWRVTIEGETPDSLDPIFPPWDERWTRGQIDQALNSFMFLDKFKVTKIEKIQQ